jgi:hypothetical protein
MTIFMRDIRRAKMCSRGARDWFALHNLDWSAFLKSGIESDVLIETGCPMALKVVEAANGRQE